MGWAFSSFSGRATTPVSRPNVNVRKGVIPELGDGEQLGAGTHVRSLAVPRP